MRLALIAFYWLRRCWSRAKRKSVQCACLPAPGASCKAVEFGPN